MRPAPTLAAAALVALGALGAAACGVDTDDEPRPIPQDNLPADQVEETPTTGADAAAPAGEPEAVVVWFTQAFDDEVRLVEAVRDVPSPHTEGDVIDALLQEPPGREDRDRGIVTAIPSTTAQASPPVRQDGGVLLISLTDGIFDVEGQTLQLAFGQLVCTATRIDGVTGVLFQVGGEPQAAFDGTGREVNGPVTCTAYDNLRQPE